MTTMYSFSNELITKARDCIAHLTAHEHTIVTAESCTGGLLAASLTEISGASKVFAQGFIVYSNHAKRRLLDVPLDLLEKYGAVSREVATEMARGALQSCRASMSLAITGIAGPEGGSRDKPVGLVYISRATQEHTKTVQHLFSNSRQQVRYLTVLHALSLILAA